MPDEEPVETPPDGIRATYEVTFTPGEAKRVRVAASAAGSTVCAYLHDLALREAPGNVRNEIVVHVQGTAPDGTALRRIVEQQMRRVGFGRS